MSSEKAYLASVKRKVFMDEKWFSEHKAPDMSPLDTGLCPYMEREVEAAGAVTADEIRKAVRKAWKGITRDIITNVMKRVRRNMLAVIENKGGNFYHE